MPSPIHFVRRVGLGIDTGVGGTTTVLPTASVTVTPRPRVFGGEAVLTDVNGERVEAPREAKYHLDVEIEWRETGEALWSVLAPLYMTLVEAPSSYVKTFYPVVSASGVVDTNYEGIEVVVEHNADMLPFTIDGSIRRRASRLRLPGKSLIAAADLPSWLLV